MTYILDSDWLISFLNGWPEATELVDRLAADGLSVSVVSCGEAIEGLLGVPDSTGRLSQLIGFLETLEVLAVDFETSRLYAGVRRDLRLQGQLIADNDLWIAATALSHDLTLLTRDRHFDRVPGLKLYQQVQ